MIIVTYAIICEKKLFDLYKTHFLRVLQVTDSKYCIKNSKWRIKNSYPEFKKKLDTVFVICDSNTH